MLDQWQAVVAEEHRALDEHRRRSKTAARDQLLDVCAQPRFVFVGRDLREKFFFVESDFLHDFAHHVVFADVLVVCPIALEHAFGVTRNHAMLIGDQRPAHRLDRVDREHRRAADLEAVKFCPVAEVLHVIFRLDWNRLGAALVHRRIDRVEQPADQDRPPDQISIVAQRDVLDLGESQIGPRTRAVVEKFELLRHRLIPPLYCSSVHRRSHQFCALWTPPLPSILIRSARTYPMYACAWIRSGRWRSSAEIHNTVLRASLRSSPSLTYQTSGTTFHASKSPRSR